MWAAGKEVKRCPHPKCSTLTPADLKSHTVALLGQRDFPPLFFLLLLIWIKQLGEHNLFAHGKKEPSVPALQSHPSGIKTGTGCGTGLRDHGLRGAPTARPCTDEPSGAKNKGKGEYSNPCQHAASFPGATLSTNIYYHSQTGLHTQIADSSKAKRTATAEKMCREKTSQTPINYRVIKWVW